MLWSSVCAVIYLLALWSKETAVSLPFVLAAYGVLVYFTGQQKKISKIVLSLVPTLVVSILYAVIRGPHLVAIAKGPMENHPVTREGILSLGTDFLWGLRWSFSIFIEPIRKLSNIIAPDLSFLLFAIGFFVILAVIIAGLFFKRKPAKISLDRKAIFYLLLGTFWFLIFFIPAGLTHYLAMYYFLLPLAGVCIWIGVIYNNIIKPFWETRFPQAWLIAVLSLFFVFSAWFQVKEMHLVNWPSTDARLAKATIEKVIQCKNTVPGQETLYFLDFPPIWYDDMATAAVRIYYNPNGNGKVMTSAGFKKADSNNRVAIQFNDGVVLGCKP
jgi:hypothetical protein